MKYFFLSLFLFVLTAAGCGRDQAFVYSLEYADMSSAGGISAPDTEVSDRIFDYTVSKENATQESAVSSGNELTVKKTVNINTADEAELMSLKGVGRVRAAAIIEYRKQNGDFAAIEDIMNVSGIKEGTFAKIRDSITVR
ncbi:MAG: helix-hairpin-helix domain-containing protein [Lachnospiraceae bacterium]|nr:helix-hairpin-helix domain-containing protein [Lachnospiraceae bacterium]